MDNPTVDKAHIDPPLLKAGRPFVRGRHRLVQDEETDQLFQLRRQHKESHHHEDRGSGLETDIIEKIDSRDIEHYYQEAQDSQPGGASVHEQDAAEDLGAACNAGIWIRIPKE